MKKFINIMLALALTVGVASITVAQDAPKDAKTTTKKGSKKNKDAKGDTKSGDAKANKKGGKKKGDAKDAPTK
jgi:uncharacterized protein YxeA